MSERGKALYATLSTGSNTNVKSGAGTLYAVHVFPANGSSVRIEDATDLGAAPNLNTSGTSTIELQSGYTSATPAFVGFGPGVGFNTGLTIAATSNARVVAIYE